MMLWRNSDWTRGVIDQINRFGGNPPNLTLSEVHLKGLNQTL